MELWARGKLRPEAYELLVPKGRTRSRRPGETAPRDPLVTLTKQLAEKRQRIEREVLAWAKTHGVASEDDPLIRTLVKLGVTLGWDVLKPILDSVKAKDPLAALAEIVCALAERDQNSAEAITLARGLIGQLETAINAANLAVAGEAERVREIEQARERAVRLLGRLALADGSLTALTAALSAFYDLHIYRDADVAALQDAVHKLLSRTSPGDADDLKEIASGRLSDKDLKGLAEDAFNEGRLDVFVAAAVKLIRRGGPLSSQAAQAIALVSMLRDTWMVTGDTQAKAALDRAVKSLAWIQENLSREKETLARKTIAAGKTQEELRRLLEKVRNRDASKITADEWKILDTIDSDAHILADANFSTWVGRVEDGLANRWASAVKITAGLAAQIKELERLRLMLLTAPLPDGERLGTLGKAVGDAQRAINAELEDEFAHPPGDGYGRLDVLRAIADAADELRFGLDKTAIDDALHDISDALTTHIYTGAPTLYNKWITGLLERVQKLPAGSEEARLLRSQINYLRHRRLNLYLIDPVGHGRARLEADAKLDEELWKALRPFAPAGLSDELGWMFGDTAENRALKEVQDYNLWELPGQVWELSMALEDPKGLMAFLAEAQKDKVLRGNAAWTAYVNTPWYRRGLFHQTAQILRTAEILDKMFQTDEMLRIALRAGSTTAVDKLPPDLRKILEDRKFIETGPDGVPRYVVPKEFRWNPTSVGEIESQPDWSDQVFNVAHFAQLAVTWYIGGIAAEAVQGLRAEKGASLLAQFLWGGVRVTAEATIFTGLQKSFQGDIFAALSGHWSAKDLLREWLENVVAIGGLTLVGPALEAVGEELTLAFPGKAPADSWRAAISTLTRNDWIKLLNGTVVGTFKAGVEGGLLTFGGAAVDHALGGSGALTLEGFLQNIAVVAQMKSMGLLSAGAADRLLGRARTRASEYLKAQEDFSHKAEEILKKAAREGRHELTQEERSKLAEIRGAYALPGGIDAWLEFQSALRQMAEAMRINALQLEGVMQGMGVDLASQVQAALRPKKRAKPFFIDVIGAIVESAAEAQARKKGETVVNLNVATESINFPLLDIITGWGVASCKAYSDPASYPGFLRHMLKTTDYRTFRRQRNAALRLIALKQTLGKKLPWPKDLGWPTTVRKVINYINGRAELLVPTDHVGVTKQAIRQDAEMFPEKWGLHGKPGTPEFEDPLANILERVRDGGATVDQIDQVLHELGFPPLSR